MVLPDRWTDTELVRYREAPAPLEGVVLMALLVAAMLSMATAFAMGIIGSISLPQEVLGLLLGGQFIDMALIVIVYFKYFLPYMVIARDEHPEDVLW